MLFQKPSHHHHRTLRAGWGVDTVPLRFAVLAIAVGAASIALRAQDWNQWRGPSRTGVAAAFTTPSAWPDKPTKAWQVKIGSGHSSPVVAAGRVFQLSRLGEEEVVTALDLSSGKQIWQQRYGAPYEMNPAAQSHGKGPKSTPVVAGTRLFTLGIDGALSAFDTASGKVLWRKRYAKEFDDSSPDFGVAMSPIVEGGAVIAHVGGNKSGSLVALDAATGAEKWAWKGDGPAYASPVAATFGKSRQVITQSRSNVVGVSATDGALLWRIPLTTSYNQNIVTPVIADGLVIYTGLEKPLTAVRPTETAGKWTPQPVWENADVPMYMSSPVLSGGSPVRIDPQEQRAVLCRRRQDRQDPVDDARAGGGERVVRRGRRCAARHDNRRRAGSFAGVIPRSSFIKRYTHRGIAGAGVSGAGGTRRAHQGCRNTRLLDF